MEHRLDEEYKTLLPALYETFLVNVWDYRERVVPLRSTTLSGLKLLHRLDVVPDFIYVDAAHDYESVKQDVLTAKKLFPEATLAGDDFNWQDVKRAVLDCGFSDRLCHNGRCWWVKR